MVQVSKREAGVDCLAFSQLGPLRIVVSKQPKDSRTAKVVVHKAWVEAPKVSIPAGLSMRMCLMGMHWPLEVSVKKIMEGRAQDRNQRLMRSPHHHLIGMGHPCK